MPDKCIATNTIFSERNMNKLNQYAKELHDFLLLTGIKPTAYQVSIHKSVRDIKKHYEGHTPLLNALNNNDFKYLLDWSACKTSNHLFFIKTTNIATFYIQFDIADDTDKNRKGV